MSHHSIIVRLGATDTAPVVLGRADTRATEIQFVDGDHRPGFGIGQALDQIREMGLRPSETSIDLGLLAAAVTAADTRISRASEAEDAWTREIAIHVPVQSPALWTPLTSLITTTLDFLTGDHWSVHFRARAPAVPNLASAPDNLDITNATSVCLFSGGLDSFIGAIDLIAGGDVPILVSHYWDGITSRHQAFCSNALERQFPGNRFHHINARVGFSTGTVDDAGSENTLRGRSFLFFALATMAADTLGGSRTVHVPENGLISLNVPLDPLRLGALSTRTTHPFYMARFNDILRGLGLTVSLRNRYGHMTKGEMMNGCGDRSFLFRNAHQTMSCSSPGTRRYDPDPAERTPKHCGRCVPCLIRRAAIRAAGIQDRTPYRIRDLSAQPLNSDAAEGENVRSFQLAMSRLRRNPGRARFDIHRPGPLTDHPNDLAAYERVYVDGLTEVGRLLQNVTATPR